MKKSFLLAVPVVLALATGCASRYELASVSRSRILIDKRFDAQPDAEAARFMAPFTQQVDSLMSPIVGQTARYMASRRPESELTNLLPDILIWASSRFDEQPDFAVYNVGGIRAALPEGDVTVGDVLDVAPFENKICFLTLSGDKVLELFRQMAMRRGECVSHAVRLVISKNGQLIDAKVDGQPIAADRSYRIATLDYVAQGNDQLTAFKAKTDVVSPQEEENNVRYLIMDYFRQQAAQGKKVDCPIEGRIVEK